MTDTEIWKSISGFENNYEVSNLGNVRNKKTNKSIKLSKKGNYYSVPLVDNNGIRKSLRVHRLVAIEFIPNPENKPEVNHIDKNGINNNISNLNWMTHQENCKHRSNGVKISNNRNIPVNQIDIKTNNIINTFKSMEDASKWLINNKLTNSLASAKSCLCTAIKNHKSVYGFMWQKVEQLTNTNEIWKEIIFSDNIPTGHYISSLGRYKNKKGNIMENYKIHHSGYIYVRINYNTYPIHRLVALAFLPNLENKENVVHYDGNKINNNVNNLYWATSVEINNHNYNMGFVKSFTKQIIQYDLKMNEIQKFNSIKEASETLNIKNTTISACLNNRQKTAGKYIWKYLDKS